MMSLLQFGTPNRGSWVKLVPFLWLVLVTLLSGYITYRMFPLQLEQTRLDQRVIVVEQDVFDLLGAQHQLEVDQNCTARDLAAIKVDLQNIQTLQQESRADIKELRKEVIAVLQKRTVEGE